MGIVLAKASSGMENHRVRVGRERRERMRAHLLDSVLNACSGETSRDPAVIDDVIREAKVSRGTFYKYFDSLDQAIAEMGLQLGVEMTAGILSVYDVLEDPVMRTATGFQMFLLRSIIDQRWGAFITHIGLLRGNNLLVSKIKADISLGVKTGAYAVRSIDFATDLLMGAKIEAIRRIIAGEHRISYVHSIAGMVLRSFGVSASKADRSVIRAYDRLGKEAPSKVSWWKPIK